MYVSYLEWSNGIITDLNSTNEQIVSKQDLEIFNYKSLVINKDSVISNYKGIMKSQDLINSALNTKVEKYKKRANNWPYWLGGGCLGGAIICLILTR